MSTLASPPTASTPQPATWTWRATLLATTILADLAYAMLIVAGIALDGRDRMVPAQISQIIVGALAATTVITAFLVICGRLADRVECAVVIVAGLAAQLRTDLENVRETARALRGEAPEIQAQLDRTPPVDDPTVRLDGHANGHRTVYASASVHTQFDGMLDTLRAQVDQRVDEAIGAKVQEFGAQKWYAGYAAGREDSSDSSVVALQPRNGQRSTS
jgi:hypothetical protein